MKLAIMQPYFFPYLGYFQMLHAVDRLVLYDDVAFPRHGWVHRNRLLVGGSPTWFTLPLRQPSRSRTIQETRLDGERLPHWRRRFLRTLRETYAAFPARAELLDLVQRVLEWSPEGLGAVAQASVEACCVYLGLHPEIGRSSRDHPAGPARGQERVLEICRREGASYYVNLPGGRSLYDSRAFAREGIRLIFLEPELAPYYQPVSSFVPGLSILDVLLRLSQDDASAACAGGSLQ